MPLLSYQGEEEEASLSATSIQNRSYLGAKLNLAQVFLGKEGRSADDLVKLLPFFEEGYVKAAIAEGWIIKQTDETEVGVVINLFPDADTRAGLSEAFARKERVLSRDPVMASRLEGMEVGARKIIIQQFVENNNFSGEEAVREINRLGNDLDRSRFAQAWIKQGARSADDVVKVLPLIGEKGPVILDWASDFVNLDSPPNPKDFAKVMSFADKRNQSKCADIWLCLKAISDEGLSAHDLVEVLPFIEEEKDKASVVEDWIKKQSNATETEVEVVLNLFPEGAVRSKLHKAFLVSQEENGKVDSESKPFVGEEKSEPKKVLKGSTEASTPFGGKNHANQGQSNSNRGGR